jgi:hypothetical protein
MKLNELISSFEIFVSNEERSLLENITKPVPLSSFDERDQVIINNLIRKSVISKILYNDIVMVMPNEF